MAILKVRDADGNVTEIPAISGVGIKNIEKTSTSGLVDTYTITLTDDTTYIFTVTNGCATPDWDQNDEAAIDYVKNRTHYRYEGEPITTFPETELTVAVDANGDATVSVDPSAFTFDGLDSGDTMVTVIDGVEYRSTLFVEFVILAWGNWGLQSSDAEDDGGPVFVMPDTDGSGKLTFKFRDESWVGTHTISVKGLPTEYQTLPYEYAPAAYAYETDLSEGKIPDEDATNILNALNAGARATVVLDGVTYSVLDIEIESWNLNHTLLLANADKLVQVTWVSDTLNIVGLDLAEKALILPSSTTDSTKRFKITVDDSGTISATELI